MTTIIQYQVSADTLSAANIPHPYKRKRHLVATDPGMSSIQFRCDSCLQQQLACSSQKPCGHCKDNDIQCTIDGGKPVKKSSASKIGPPKLTVTTTQQPSEVVPPPARRGPGRPRSQASSKPGSTPSRTSPAAARRSTLAEPSPGPSASAAPVSQGLLPPQASTSHIPIMPQIAKPKAAAPTQIPTPDTSSSSRPLTWQRGTSTPDMPVATSSFPAPQASPGKAAPSSTLTWTNAKADDTFSGKNADIVQRAFALLGAIRAHHQRHPASELALAEMQRLLEGPTYVLRTQTVAMQQPGRGKRPVAAAAAAAVMAVDGATDDEDVEGAASAGMGKGKRKRQATTAGKATRATARLAAWIEGSKVIDEAVWVLRGLKAPARQLDDAVEVPEWMLCE